MLPVVVGIEGEALTASERELFTRLQPAGYILFSRNIADHELTRELTDDLRRITGGPDAPIIAIDQEGGRVVRTAAIGVQMPSAAALAATGSAHTIRQAALYTLNTLHTLGVNTDFAPVLDLASPHANALPSRCWGSDTQDVISRAGVWNRTLCKGGIMTCGKHFPGMGDAACDPHHELPVLHGTRASFLERASIPFAALMPELPSLMVAHLLIPEMDAEHPTSLSRELVQGFLRDQLGYEGVVFTDDLCMGAIANGYGVAEATALALRAGCDLPLVCHNVCDVLEDVAAAVNALPPEVLAPAAERIEKFRMMMVTAPPMPFIVWRDYLNDMARFCESVPEVSSTPGSPVQNY